MIKRNLTRSIGQLLQEKRLLRGIIDQGTSEQISTIGGKEYNKLDNNDDDTSDEEFTDADKVKVHIYFSADYEIVKRLFTFLRRFLLEIVFLSNNDFPQTNKKIRYFQSDIMSVTLGKSEWNSDLKNLCN